MNHKQILHITPHLGGGIGTVVLNYLKSVSAYKDEHSIATLDYANEKSIQTSKEFRFKLYSDMHKNISGLLELISNADIVVFHFWNHPLLYDFLVRNELPASRIVFWLHTAGHNPPYIFPEKALKYPDICVLSTPLTYDTKEVKALKDKSHLRLIWATGGNEALKNIEFKPHKTFNVGYIGTVDYFRLYPDFLNICKKVNIPNVKFIFCGGPKHKEFQKQAIEMGLQNKVEFLGEVSDVKKYFAQFDIFAYMLARTHCGSCDQALQEAMTAGIAPVVFDNPMECSMVEHNKTGLIAKNEDEFVKCIEEMYKNSDLRQKLAQNAKKYANEQYSLEKVAKDWDKIFDETLKLPKTTKKWNLNKNNPSYFDIFLESLGDFSDNFVIKSDKDVGILKELGKTANWQSETKGTVHQYAAFFQSDSELAQISKIMKQEY